MSLRCKVPGNAGVQGKPRVFFCCHPADFDTFFAPLSEEIQQLQNCAIYYYDEAPVSAEERHLDLKQMQLFVMPVTTRLLTKENQAMADFRFAIENHIPVLPLLQEQGLDTLFREKCGDLQYLSCKDWDPTAIPYREKLEKYLSSVLIGDSLAARIRASFDAYIFLSYRKKDRQHAQNLMRRIHQNDFCRDIAIWYDEFLTPGENFNTSIQAALEKSSLFAMVVTPNLISEQNYIMRVEYPMARANGKPILPFEMVPTDAAALRSSYQDIPAAAPAWDGEALRGALLQAIAPKKKDADPEQDYFIGLAYLGGVDVEVDHERALKLITSAAEAGMSLAMEKLAAMYENGEGVARDYRESIRWQEKLAALWEWAYAEKPCEDTYTGYISALWDLDIKLRDVSDLTRAEEVCKHMLQLAVAAEYPRCRGDIANSHYKLGGICLHQRDLSNAMEHLKKCLEIFEDLAAETGTAKARRDLAAAYLRLGAIYRDEYDLTASIKYCEKALQITEALAGETDAVTDRMACARAYAALGNTCWEQEDYPSARECCRMSLEIVEAAAAESSREDRRYDLSVLHSRLGDICRKQEDFSGAQVCFEKSMQIARTLAAETESMAARRLLFHLCSSLGELSLVQGKTAAAVEYYEEELRICESLAAETGTVEDRRNLYGCCLSLGQCSGRQNDLPAAANHYERAVRIARELVDETDSAERMDDYAIACFWAGSIGQKEYLVQAFGLWSLLAEYYPKIQRFARRRDKAKELMDVLE